MSYAKNVGLSLPMAIIIYMLTEKIIINLTSENKFSERVQKSFVISFVIGLCFIAIGMSVLGEKSNIHNQPLQYSFYISGVCLLLNSVFVNWDNLDENTKMLILGISIIGFILYSYANKTTS